MKLYCFKVKWPLLKVKENNAYAHAKIEEFGFEPIFQEFDEGPASWAGGWAKKISVGHDTKIGQWIKSNIENIYKTEKDKEDSKWKKEILESGYEFDAEGKLIENKKLRESTSAELCIMKEGYNHGTLFINLGGAIEFYSVDTLRDCCPGDIAELETAHVIYEKRLRD